MATWDILLLILAMLVVSGLLLIVSRWLPLREHTDRDGLADIIAQREARVERTKQKTRSLFRRARHAVKQGVLGSAEELLYQAAGLDEEDPQLLKELVETLSSQGKLDKARIAAEKLTTLAPEMEHFTLHANILLELGIESHDDLLLQQSRDSFDQILFQMPENIAALNGMAAYARYSGDHQGAFDYWQRSYELDSSQKSVGLELVTHYTDYLDTEGIRTLWTKILNHFPTDQAVIEARMRQLIGLKLFEDALALYDSALKTAIESAALVRLASLCYYQQKDYARSASLLETLLERGPELIDFYNLALSEYNQKAYVAAATTLQKAIDQNASDARFHLLMGKIHLNSGDKSAAARDFMRVMELDPRHYEALRYLKRVS